MNGKYFLPLALVAVMTVAAGCQRRADADDCSAFRRLQDKNAKALARCDSIIQASTDSLSSENPLLLDYHTQVSLIDELHDAYVEKERLLEERIIDNSAGDMKLFLYKEFERSHRLYDVWAEQNDSLIYATEPLSAPWIECRCQRIDKLTEHIKILEKHAQQPYITK